MKLQHTPFVDLRYWCAILLASVFGTNLGDLYAHTTHLGIVRGLALLALLAACVFVLERLTSRPSIAFYWVVIIIIRTGATNIADYLAYHVRIPELLLSVSVAVLIALFGWLAGRPTLPRAQGTALLPHTGPAYWLAMLAAGVFGTVVGDVCEHAIGEGVSSIVLLLLLAVALLLAPRARIVQIAALYWLFVTIARTAGTAVGDWLAESKALHIGLPLSTLLSGVAFVAVVAFWSGRPAPSHAAGSGSGSLAAEA